MLTKYRKCTLKQEPITELIKFKSAMDSEKYVKFEAKMPDGRMMLVVLFDVNSSVIKIKSSFSQKILKNLANFAALLLVSGNVDEIKNNRSELIPKNIYVESLGYEVFSTEQPKHELVPKHEVMTEEEVKEFEKTHFTDRRKFPTILVSDPGAVWIGLRPDQCARITRTTETAGISIVYRYCRG